MGEPPDLESFAARLAQAMLAEGKTRSRIEREVGLHRGYMTRLLSGERGAKAVSPELIRQLADYLHVSYEWLAIGRGPMRYPSWAPTAFDRAALFARSIGISDKAIFVARGRFEDEADGPLTEVEWLNAFVTEAQRIERRRAPSAGEPPVAPPAAKKIRKR